MNEYSPPPPPPPTPAPPPPPPSAPPPGATPVVPAPPKKSKTGLIIGIVLVLLLCCCAAVGGGVWWFLENAEEIDTSSSTEDAVSVTLTWTEAVDLNLEVWDETGADFLDSADDDEGPNGSETFVFDDKGYRDYSTGEWIVDVYFASWMESEIGEVQATLEVRTPDGRTETRTGTAYWDIDRDQWHAFRIDGATGSIVDVNEYPE